MNVKYDAEADILMCIFRDVPPVNAISEPGGMVVSYDEHEEPISIEFLNAYKRKLIDPQNLQLAIATELGIPLKAECETLLSELGKSNDF